MSDLYSHANSVNAILGGMRFQGLCHQKEVDKGVVKCIEHLQHQILDLQRQIDELKKEKDYV